MACSKNKCGNQRWYKEKCGIWKVYVRWTNCSQNFQENSSRQKSGKITTVEFTVLGRKIPLATLRQRLLDDQERHGLFRLKADQDYEEMSSLEVTSRLEELHEHKATQSMNPDLQKDYLKKIERSRHLLAWGNHSTILNHGICYIW